jgi:hypothetical protein
VYERGRFEAPMNNGLLYVTLDRSGSAKQFENFPAIVTYLDTSTDLA